MILEDMVGITFDRVYGSVGDSEMRFFVNDECCFMFFHDQDCCETVLIEDIAGDLNDLVGSPLLVAAEVSGEGPELGENVDSFTWTFYKFATVKGHVTVRWLGESNGYYSERVDVKNMMPPVPGLRDEED